MGLFRDDIVEQVPHLRAFARTMAQGDVALADDLVQDTIVNALGAQDQFTPGSNLRAWLFTILRNRFRSVISRKHVTAEVGDADLEDLSWIGPEQEARIEVAAFKRAFRALNPSQREALVLVAVHGLNHERVAEICGCEVGTIKSRVSRARLLLRQMLLGQVPMPPDPQALDEARSRHPAPPTAAAPVGSAPRLGCRP
jgi:RNA polymerase sigma-70 factor (ECF subfamily)